MDVSCRRNKYESRLLIRPTYCFLVKLLIPRDAYAAYPTVLRRDSSLCFDFIIIYINDYKNTCDELHSFTGLLVYRCHCIVVTIEFPRQILLMVQGPNVAAMQDVLSRLSGEQSAKITLGL